MLKIAVCDDDKWIRKYLKTVIERELYAKTDLYSSGEELLAAREIYDILFMDVWQIAKMERQKMGWKQPEKFTEGPVR